MLDESAIGAPGSTGAVPAGGAAGQGRLSRLAKVTAELSGCTELSQVVDVVVGHAPAAVGAVVASISLLDSDDRLHLAGLQGGRAGAEQEWSSYSLDAQVPTSESLRTRRTLVVAGRDEIETRYPLLAGAVGEGRTLVCLPLTAGGARLGVISLGLHERAPDPEEIEFLEIFAVSVAQCIVRIRAVDEADAAAARLALLSEVSAILAQSLDYNITLAAVARLTVPVLADWCAVEILEDGRLRTLAVHHTDPEKVELARRLQQDYPSDPNSPTGSPNVVRTGLSEIYPEVTDDMLVAGARDDEHLRLSRELRLSSGLVVPLIARSRVLGAITLVFAESGRRYVPADIAFAEVLARRAAMAIDNADLFTQTQKVAEQLQRAVLPDALPIAPGLEIVAHYRPSGRTEVGGDFYDAVLVPDGRLAVFVGDVAGRGVAAAAAMAQSRTAVRACLALDPEPVSVLGHLDAIHRTLDDSRMVTLLYALIDRERDVLTIVSAGHPPAIMAGPGRSTSVLWPPSGPPLGLTNTGREALRVPFPQGSTLLLYTDGLVETRTHPIDDGISTLRAALQDTLATGDLRSGLIALTTELSSTDDDITALAIHHLPPADGAAPATRVE